MALIINIQHFLNEDGEVLELNPEEMGLLNFMIAIIDSASFAYERPVSLANVNCCAVNDGERCGGEIEVWIDPDSHEIGWECLECEDEGIITNWEGTQWDRRDPVRH
jgi:hypothetical protein